MKLKAEQIVPNIENPRYIKDENFRKLVQSLKDFPEMADVRPLVVNKEYVILGGNMRFKAMQQAGWTEIPVTVVDWPEDKQKEFIIKDNVSGGDWDWDVLANEWDATELEAWGLDLPAKFGDEEVEEDEAPEVSKDPPQSVLGAVYQLGRHRVMCGDSTDKANVELLMDGVKADMVFTDPPYGMDLDTDYAKRPLTEAASKKHKSQNSYSAVIGDDRPYDPQHIFDMFGYCNEIFLWGGDYYAQRLPETGSWIVWDKKKGVEDVDYTSSEFELCWSKQKHHRKIVRVAWFGLIGTESQDVKNRIHPTQKPLQVCEYFVNKFSKHNDTIIDLFLGSGSTLIACEQTDRTCYGMELDPQYVDVIRKRYAKYTNDNELPDNWADLTPPVE